MEKWKCDKCDDGPCYLEREFEKKPNTCVDTHYYWFEVNWQPIEEEK